MINNSYTPKSNLKIESKQLIDVKKYCLKSPPNFKSKLLINLEEEKKKLEKTAQKFEDNFIESTSGQHYSLNDDQTKLLYHDIESIWNHENYWINMQKYTDNTDCNDINRNLNNTQLWEHLLPGEPWYMRNIEETKEDEQLNIQQDKHLDIPSSYNQSILHHSLDDERHFPNGRKTMLFKKTKVELYAPYIQMDGLIEKITLYNDYKYEMPRNIYEKYSNRGDKLTHSIKYLHSGLILDEYNRGRVDAMKRHRYLSIGNNTIEDDRIVEFYDVVRIDGLSKVELHPLYFTQHFVNRKDYLHYRHVEFTTDDKNLSHNTSQRQVWKITEEFNRNNKLSASNDIAIREFCIGENEIRLKYHYKDDEITRITRTFIKPPDFERGDRLVFNPNMTYGYNPNPLATPEKSVDLFHLLKCQLKEEEESLVYVRDTERMIVALLKTRSSEYGLPRIIVSMFDRNRNDEAKAGMFAQEELLRAQCEREVEQEIDYLKPYLARLGHCKQLTEAQSLQIRNECLNNIKQSLITRANNIWCQFESKRRKLDALQRQLDQNDNLSKAEEERLVDEMNAVSFDMHALDVRLKRYCDLSSSQYQSIVATLRKDKRLNCPIEY